MSKRKTLIVGVITVVCVCVVVACLIVNRGDAGGTGADGQGRDAAPVEEIFTDEGLQSCIAGAYPELAADGTDGITDLVFPMLASEHADECGDLSGVRSIEGMEKLTNLRNLDLGSMSALESGSTLAGLEKLQQLNISGTDIGDIGFMIGLSDLSQVALSPTACDVSALAGHDALQSVSIGCVSADITPLDGMDVQMVVPADFDRTKAQASAETGNTITVMNDDGSFDVYQLVNGEVAVSHV